jgi:hypothetical protein
MPTAQAPEKSKGNDLNSQRKASTNRDRLTIRLTGENEQKADRQHHEQSD